MKTFEKEKLTKAQDKFSNISFDLKTQLIELKEGKVLKSQSTVDLSAEKTMEELVSPTKSSTSKQSSSSR